MKELVYVGATHSNTYRVDNNTMAELVAIARRDSQGGPVVVRIEGGMTILAEGGRIRRLR